MPEPQTLTPATRPSLTPAQVQLNTIRDLIARSKDAISSRLPKHLTADRVMKVALTAINKTPKLLSCSRESLLMSIMQAAELGLEPGGALGEGYLVPYGNQCQFIPGYRGLISLARRSGQIISIEAHVVHDKDAFECGLGLDPYLRHTPAWDEAEPGALRFVYAVAKLKDGGVQFEVMSKAQIEKIRKASKAGNNGPWVDHFDEMARKTVIRRLFKYLPVSVELASALELQGQAEAGDFTGLTIEAEKPAVETLGTTTQETEGDPAAGGNTEDTSSQAQAQTETTPARRSRADALKSNLQTEATSAQRRPNPDDKAPKPAPLVDPNDPEAEMPWPTE